MSAIDFDSADSPLAIRLFGPMDVRVQGQPLSQLRSRKGYWLLALLVLRHGRQVERDWLAGTLWPESDQSQAYSSLRRTLTDLRQAMGAEAARLRSPTPQTLCLSIPEEAVDVLAFDAALARGDPASLRKAVALYRGPLLEGCTEAWVLQEREVWEQTYLSTLETLASLALEQGDSVAAVDYLRRVISADFLRESAYRALMQALAAGGDYAEAVQVYRELRLLLHRELQADPSAETSALFQQIREQARHRTDRSTPPSHPMASRLSSPVLTGNITFLFSDIEGSTRLWEEHPTAMRDALSRHNAILQEAIQTHRGQVFKTLGDAFCAAFHLASDALEAALSAQIALQAETGQPMGPLRVRMALHTGIAEEQGGDYSGPTLNRVARLLAIGHGGQVLLSLAARELLRNGLPERVNLKDLDSHRLRDLTDPEHVYQLLHPDLPAEFPPLKSLDSLPTNLPAPLTSFIGRETEIEQVKSLLAKTRLLTLTGAGGCGKTRLALQVAADLLEAYPDGVWLVELASLSDPMLVPQALASAVGAREEPGRLLIQTLTGYLKARKLLLLLDNCEHLVSTCAQLAASLLKACPDLRLLASSREGLGVVGEQTYRVPALSLPDREDPPSIETLFDFEAPRLFIERALLSQPDFALTSANVPAVVSVGHRLDGIPLAIELAAARMRSLTVEEIDAHLDDRFRLLAGASKTALPRHQTLRALIDWSYDLLNEQERRLLCRLSVFMGGWSLEAAEAVGIGEDIETWEVIDLLTGLVDKSLVVTESQGAHTRYRFLETIRQYAHDRLLESGEKETVQNRHAGYFLQLAEAAAPNLDGPEQVVWLDRLEAEHDNLRAALEWYKAEEDGTEVGLRLAGSLSLFWTVRGHLSEGRTYLEEALRRKEAAVPTWVRARALHGAGSLAWSQCDYQAARTLFEQSLSINRELGNRAWEARNLNSLGNVADNQGDYQAATALFQESLAIYRELGDKRGLAAPLNNLGLVAQSQGDYQAARTLFEQALTINRELGKRAWEARNLNNLGVIAQEQDDYATATALFQESLTIYRELGDKLNIAGSLHNLGAVALGLVAQNQGDYQAARTLFEQSLSINRELGNRAWEASNLIHLGIVAQEQGDYGAVKSLLEEGLVISRELEDKRGILAALAAFAHLAVGQNRLVRAVRLSGAADALREAVGFQQPPSDQQKYDRDLAAARQSLGKEAFARLWADGRTMTTEQAIAYALEAKRIG